VAVRPARSDTVPKVIHLAYALAALIPDTNRVARIEETFDTARETNARFEARRARADHRRHGHVAHHVCLLSRTTLWRPVRGIADEERGAAAFNLMRLAEHSMSRKYDDDSQQLGAGSLTRSAHSVVSGNVALRTPSSKKQWSPLDPRVEPFVYSATKGGMRS
jgi:hypothetical protein